MKLYIAGPISGIPDGNRPAFAKAALELEESGYTVVNPATLEVEGWTWAQYLRHDLPLMLKCEGVALLPGWQDSKGASLEYLVASDLGMPIRTVDEWIGWDWRVEAA